MKSSILFILRIIWLILFGFSIAVVAYFQDKLSLSEKILIISSICIFYITLFYICLKTREKTNEWEESALTPIDIELIKN